MQLSLFSEYEIRTGHKFQNHFPLSKATRLSSWTGWGMEISNIQFHTVLDAFGGMTGCVAYKLKDHGKSVTYNDILPFNSIIGKALIENRSTILADSVVDYILTEHPTINYPTFIADNFRVYIILKKENHWLDVVDIIFLPDNEYQRAIAWFAHTVLHNKKDHIIFFQGIYMFA